MSSKFFTNRLENTLINKFEGVIGSVAKIVFYPSAKRNAQINLVNRSFVKVQTFNTAFGEDNQIYSTDEIVDLHLDNLFEESFSQEELNRETILRRYHRVKNAAAERIQTSG